MSRRNAWFVSLLVSGLTYLALNRLYPLPTGPEPSSTPTSADASASPGPPSVGDDSSSGGSDAVLPIVGALIVLGAGAVYLVRRQRPTSPR